MTFRRSTSTVLALSFACTCLPARSASPTEVPLDMFTVPEGLEVTLWAQSPQLRNPTNMDIDAAGRIWVTEA